jgi:hypothetical protein
MRRSPSVDSATAVMSASAVPASRASIARPSASSAPVSTVTRFSGRLARTTTPSVPTKSTPLIARPTARIPSKLAGDSFARSHGQSGV